MMTTSAPPVRQWAGADLGRVTDPAHDSLNPHDRRAAQHHPRQTSQGRGVQGIHEAEGTRDEGQQQARGSVRESHHGERGHEEQPQQQRCAGRAQQPPAVPQGAANQEHGHPGDGAGGEDRCRPEAPGRGSSQPPECDVEQSVSGSVGAVGGQVAAHVPPGRRDGAQARHRRSGRQGKAPREMKAASTPSVPCSRALTRARNSSMTATTFSSSQSRSSAVTAGRT